MKEPDPFDDPSTQDSYGAVTPAVPRRHVVIATAAVVVLLGLVTVAVFSVRGPERSDATRAPAPSLTVPDSALPAGQHRAASPVPSVQPATSPKAERPKEAQPQPAPTQPALPAPPPKPVETPLARLKDPSGSTVTLLREGTVRVSDVSLPPELARALHGVYVLERVPDLPPVAPDAAEPVIRLTSPDPGDAGLESTAPVFRWTPVPGNTSYTFTLERLTNAGAGVWQPVEGASGQTLTRPEWVVPAEAPLTRGARYRWRVQAGQEGETLSSATLDFRVLDENEMRRLDNVRNHYGNIPFLLGPHYERFGLYEEAIWEYLKLARANPTSAQAQRALENARLRAEQHKRGE